MPEMTDYILALDKLSKSYKKGLGSKRVYGLKELSLEIQQGEILGIIGPNGAGKTTTFKLILGLIYPDQGGIKFGPALTSRGKNVKERIGFLPESPYFYSYLTVEESLDFHARLFNYPSVERKAKIEELLELVGMSHARKRQLNKLSRGMLQRVGIAQAIINDPEFLILDEPMSGLDPIGRKEIRDIIIEFGKKGKTVIFSSHILSDVEMICDRVAMIMDGELKAVGLIDDLFGLGAKEWEIEYAGPALDLTPFSQADTCRVDQKGAKYIIKLYDEKLIYPIIDMIQASQGMLLSYNPKRTELEKLYLSKAKGGHHA
jgi:ABC-2 type transport system ATP-binding protein